MRKDRQKKTSGKLWKKQSMKKVSLKSQVVSAGCYVGMNSSTVVDVPCSPEP